MSKHQLKNRNLSVLNTALVYNRLAIQLLALILPVDFNFHVSIISFYIYFFLRFIQSGSGEQDNRFSVIFGYSDGDSRHSIDCILFLRLWARLRRDFLHRNRRY